MGQRPRARQKQVHIPLSRLWCLLLLAVLPHNIFGAGSETNGVSMGVFPGANGIVRAGALATNGDYYIGGDFTIVASTFANRIAKWDGTNWSALGSGMNSNV